MGAATDYIEDKILDHLLGVEAYTPSPIYAALYLDEPGDDGAGTEVSGSGYARQEVTFGAATSGESANDIEIEFEASGDWGEITHIAYFDAPTSGNMLFKAELENARTVLEGDTLTFPVGELTLSVD